MDFLRILWDDPDDPEGNVEHIAEHGLSMDDVEDVLENQSSEGRSHSSGLPCTWGYTLEGLYILVVYEEIDYEEIDEDSIRVVTAYEVPEPRSGRST